jgi:hypothetical protein
MIDDTKPRVKGKASARFIKKIEKFLHWRGLERLSYSIARV